PRHASEHPSTAQDLARCRPTEIGHLNGYVVQRGAALGVATPVNRTLLVLVRMAEASGVHGPQDHQKT
uniref:ketopantoate reductase C-terminal domain-containing protein n=1 Tax=Diaphorobacter nitroreducens TaxID=164759 RepID=UPI0028AAF0DD